MSYNEDRYFLEMMHNCIHTERTHMKKTIIRFLSAVLAASCLGMAPSVPVHAQAEDSTAIRILFTHDLHDHISSYKTMNADGSVSMIGGYAYLAGAIDANRNDNTIVVDAGDFSMGTLYNGIYETHAPDLSLLGAMGYDAVTFGNHEFDYGPESLAASLLASTDTPAVLSANIHFTEDSDSQILKQAWEKKGGAATKIVEKGGVKIGLFGVMGDESESDIAYPGSITFDDEKEAAKTAVAELQQQGAQFIVCLSHSGTNSDDSKSEDQLLAKAVDGIDVIISGHSHTTLNTPIIENGTVIVSCGCYGRNLGLLDVQVSDDSVADYKLIPITQDIQPDAAIAASIADYKQDVQSEFLDKYGIQFDDVLAHSSFSFDDVNTSYDVFGNSNIGDLISDSYVYAYQQAGGKERAIGIGAKGIIRDDIYQGDVTLSDVYNTVSLGKGNDGLIGYPLALVYLSGKELKQAAEIDCSIGRIRSDAQMYFSGMKYTYTDSRFILNHVLDVYVESEDGSWRPIDENKLYPVVCNYYMAMMLPSITALTRNLLSFTLKDADGNAVTDNSSIILHDQNGMEVKEWSGFMNYLESFDKDSSGVSMIPASYETARDTKTALGFNLLTYFHNTSKVGWIVYGILAALIAVLWLIIHLIRRQVRKHRAKKAAGPQGAL